MTAGADLDAWIGFAAGLADESRKLRREGLAATGDRRIKADRSFVTALDLRIEERLRGMIAARFPGHGILGEELPPHNPGADLAWVLDPIDGTAHLLAGIPADSTLIALAAEGVPVLGVIDVPAIGLRWIGARGRPTTRNGETCRTRAPGPMAAAIMSTSSPDFYAPQERPALDALRAATGWRIYGAAALAYGRVADGRIDLALDAGLKPYDFAPFAPVIEGAGGVVTDWRGRPVTLDSGPRILAAGDRALHGAALDLVAAAVEQAEREQA